jgi:hypothetical protein
MSFISRISEESNHESSSHYFKRPENKINNELPPDIALKNNVETTENDQLNVTDDKLEISQSDSPLEDESKYLNNFREVN